MKKLLFFFFCTLATTGMISLIHKHKRNVAVETAPKLPSKNSAVLVIHLDRAIKREKNVQKIYHTLSSIPALKNFAKKTIQAVDGQQLTQKQIDQSFQKNLIKPYIPEEIQISNNVIACFLSHRKAWQYIVDNDLDSGLVFEDDAMINGDLFSEALQVGFDNLRSNVVIRFKHTDSTVIESLMGKYNEQISIPIIPHPVMVAYLISKSTAIKLLALTEKIDRPVDEFLKLANKIGVYSAEVYPSGITEISSTLGGSTIGYAKKVNLWQKFKREIYRLYYRLNLL